MKITEVSKLTPLERFQYWVRERQAISLKKLAGKPKPWTDDVILQNYRFTNVRRMDDKVSQWLLHHWYEPYKDHPNMVPAVALARFFNLPATLEPLTRFVFQEGHKPDWGSIKRNLRAMKVRGPIFNAAYMVRGNDGKDKIDSVIDYNVRPLADDPPVIDTDLMEVSWNNLHCRYGFGSFMAGQVVADLRWALTGEWLDRKVWAPMGPGSRRGINRIHNRSISGSLSQKQFMEELRQLVGQCQPVPGLEMIDWQNCLCEYDKYSRVLLGEGRPKQQYPGATDG